MPGTEYTTMKRKWSLSLDSSKFTEREKHVAEESQNALYNINYVPSEHEVELLSFVRNQRVTCGLKLQGQA